MNISVIISSCPCQLEVRKYWSFESLHDVSRASQPRESWGVSLNNWSRWGLVLKCKQKKKTKKQKKENKMAPRWLANVIQASKSHEIQDVFESVWFSLYFEARIFSLAAELKVLARTPPKVWARPLVEGINNDFPNQFGISRLLEASITMDKRPFWICFWLCFQQSPSMTIYHPICQLFSRTRQLLSWLWSSKTILRSWNIT